MSSWLSLPGPDDSEVIRNLVRLSQAKNVVLSREADGALAWGGQSFFPSRPFRFVSSTRLERETHWRQGFFSAGWGGGLEHGLLIGAVLAALALTQKGDMITTTPAEVNSLLEGEPGGIKR